MKKSVLFLSIPFLLACSSEPEKPEVTKLPVTDSALPTSKDSSATIATPVLTGLELFIDSMKKADYLIDTDCLKQVIWSDISKYPKAISEGHVIIQMPFPVEEYKQHLSDPKTYFFAHWDEKEKTFKHGNDYLLMTWAIDSAGIRKEEKIYTSLHGYMGNFPCYIFRSKNTVYAMAHRMTVHAMATRELTEKLRNYIDPASQLYRPFGGEEPK
jgi:hypothetical protein